MGVELERQGGRLCWATPPEGNEIFDLTGGRYGSGAPNLELLLKGHSGEQIHSLRIGREEVRVDRPALTIVSACQPVVLERLRRRPGELERRGVMGRFLFCVPRTRVGYRALTHDTISVAVMERYREEVRRLFAMRTEAPPRVLRLSFEPMASLFARGEVAVRPGGSAAHMKSWVSRLSSHTARLAGLLHLAGGEESLIVSDETLHAAVRLADFYWLHALGVWAMAGGDEQTGRALQLFDYCARRVAEQRTPFTVRDLHRSASAVFPTRADIAAPIALLVESGYLRLVTQPRSEKGGNAPSAGVDVSDDAYRRWRRR